MRFALAFLYIVAGGMKLFAYDVYTRITTRKWSGEGAIPRGIAIALGICEVAGGIALCTPAARIAAAVLAALLLAAAIFHRKRAEACIAALLMSALTVLMTWGPGS